MEQLFTAASPVGAILMALGVPFAVALPATMAAVGVGCGIAAGLFRRQRAGA